jgi:hypothetical protein
MIEVSLNKNEYGYLCQKPFFQDKFQNHIFYSKENKMFLLKISEDEADELRDLCGEQLQITGFDEKYDLTPEGKILDSLIDRLLV